MLLSNHKGDTDGHIAILQPKPNDIEYCKTNLIPHEQYDNLRNVT
jgi:hypothetical protein